MKQAKLLLIKLEAYTNGNRLQTKINLSQELARARIPIEQVTERTNPRRYAIESLQLNDHKACYFSEKRNTHL